ncbi:MAG: globin domain-containing protein [Saccharolobus sp.]
MVCKNVIMIKMELDEKERDITKSTVPFLQDQGVKVTIRMYELLFQRYPETKKLFEKDVSESLAKALLIYAKNIELPLDSMKSVLSKIALSHVRAGVKPNHYNLVWECLKDAMSEFVSDKTVLVAWEKGYWRLASYLIELENKIYKTLE